MPSGSTAPQELPPLACPGCREPLFPRAEQVGKKLTCHVCGGAVLVPSPELAKPKAVQPKPAPPVKKRRPRDEESRTYGVREDFESPPSEEYLLMVCPLCSTRLHAHADQLGETLSCPDCGTKVKVVRSKAPPPKPPRTSREIGEYEVCFKEATETRNEDHFLVKCFTCDTRLHPRRDWVGKSIECPDCGRRMIVPKPPPPPVKRELPKVAEMPLSSEPVVQRQPMREPVQPDAIAYRNPTAVLPDSPFVAGILSFPLRGEAFARWGMLGFGLAATGFVTVLGVMLSGDNKGIAGAAAGMGLVICGLIAIMTGAITFTFAAAYFMAIVVETANGADEIEGWPDADWREGLFTMLAVGFQMAIAGAASYGLALLLDRAAGGFGLWFAGAMFAIFPMLLLSSLAADSPFSPFSSGVLKSLFQQPFTWLKFYFASGILLAAVAAPTLGVGYLSPLTAVFVSAPFWSAAMFMYARLLGRLGWKASLMAPAKNDD